MRTLYVIVVVILLVWFGCLVYGHLECHAKGGVSLKGVFSGYSCYYPPTKK